VNKGDQDELTFQALAGLWAETIQGQPGSLTAEEILGQLVSSIWRGYFEDEAGISVLRLTPVTGVRDLDIAHPEPPLIFNREELLAGLVSDQLYKFAEQAVESGQADDIYAYLANAQIGDYRLFFREVYLEPLTISQGDFTKHHGHDVPEFWLDSPTTDIDPDKSTADNPGAATKGASGADSQDKPADTLRRVPLPGEESGRQRVEETPHKAKPRGGGGPKRKGVRELDRCFKWILENRCNGDLDEFKAMRSMHVMEYFKRYFDHEDRRAQKATVPTSRHAIVNRRDEFVTQWSRSDSRL